MSSAIGQATTLDCESCYRHTGVNLFYFFVISQSNGADGICKRASHPRRAPHAQTMDLIATATLRMNGNYAQTCNRLGTRRQRAKRYTQRCSSTDRAFVTLAPMRSPRKLFAWCDIPWAAKQDFPRATMCDIPRAGRQGIPRVATQDIPRAAAQSGPQATTRSNPRTVTQGAPWVATQNIPREGTPGIPRGPTKRTPQAPTHRIPRTAPRDIPGAASQDIPLTRRNIPWAARLTTPRARGRNTQRTAEQDFLRKTT